MTREEITNVANQYQELGMSLIKTIGKLQDKDTAYAEHCLWITMEEVLELTYKNSTQE